MEEMNQTTPVPEEIPRPSNGLAKSKKGLPKMAKILILIVILIIIAIISLTILSGYQVTSIRAAYNGATAAGTLLDNSNTGIVVTGKNKNGDTVDIPLGEWNITSPKKLEADSSTIVRISYEDNYCELKVACTDSNVASIEAYYDGDRAAGTTISNITEGFSAIATLKNGTKIDITDQCEIVDGPITIQADIATPVQVKYTDPVNSNVFTHSFSVTSTTRTVKRISAKYQGEAKEGEVLDSNNSGFVVTATFNNGDVEVVKGWEIKEPATLANSHTSTVVISYGGQDFEISVDCSVFDPEVYKDRCESISYNDLARNPDAYDGALIKIIGKISRIESGANSDSGYIYHVYVNSSSKYIRVAYNGTLDTGNLIEDDYITCYGEYLGIDSTDYNESPLMNARVIERRY